MSDEHSTNGVEYRPVEGFPDYRVSGNGEVWSRQKRTMPGEVRVDGWRQLKPYVDKRRGYLHVTLSNNAHTKGLQIHRLVLLAFVGPCPQGMECRHLNGNPADNRLENLQWGTPGENYADAVKHGTSCKGKANGMAKLTEPDVRTIRQRYAAGDVTYEALAKEFHVSLSVVGFVVQRQTWKHIP